MTERGWVTVENAVEIAWRHEDVFDYLTDITNEVGERNLESVRAILEGNGS